MAESMFLLTMLCIAQSGIKYSSTFDLDLIQIEHDSNITRVTWTSKNHPEHRFSKHCNVKQDFIDYI